MSRFELDFSHLKEAVQPDRSRIPLKGNEHHLTRVAFDLFRMDNDTESLWQVQADDDGNEFLVRTYDVDQHEDLQAKSNWSVDADKKQANLTISYRGMPIHRLAAADFGAQTPAETRSLQKLVLSKLAADKEFINSLIDSLPAPKREALVTSFPELTSHAAADDEVAGLVRFLANTQALTLKTQGFHWNVTGTHFGDLHALFDKQYNELNESRDVIAERIRALQAKSPGSLAEMQRLSTLPESSGNLSEPDMVAALLADNEAMAKEGNELIKSLTAAGDEASANMLAERVMAHEKAAWMLRSVLDKNASAPETESPKTHAGWHASADGSFVVIAHNDKRVARLASAEFGANDSETFRHFIQEKLDARDEDFLRSVIVHQARCDVCGFEDMEEEEQDADTPKTPPPILPKIGPGNDPIEGLPPVDLEKEYGLKIKPEWKPKLPAWMKA